ncbi:translation initiation factor 4e protein [Rutstroemia sp. NJR-2017a WRK4]|nr:translation initiation factor 4e protein [Rutstroemia sp. NJR-2017a WRK4]
MDNLWTRRSNSSKLSLATGNPTTNGSPFNGNDHSTRGFGLAKRHGDTSSHSTKNPFNAMSPSGTSLASPTAGASSAFGLGTGAFASFGSSKAPKTPGGTLDFGSIVGGGTKTPTAEKPFKDLASKTSKISLTDSKTTTPPPQHNFRHGWVFWYRPPISKANGFVEYEKTLHPMAGFNSAEDLFEIFDHMRRPSSLPLVSDYHMFKKGIRPVWEDEENKKGGKWIVRLKKGVADRYWEELVFAIAGDEFEASEEVCGVVLSVRNGEDILSIWTRNDGGRVLKIREALKRVLSFPPDTKVEWKSHDSSIQQRTAIDEARKEKANNHHNNRNGNDHTSEKKTTS